MTVLVRMPHRGGDRVCAVGLAVLGLFSTSWRVLSVLTQCPFSKTWD